MPPQKSSERERMWRLAGQYSAIGIELAIVMLAPILLGGWLDNRWDYAPWGMGGGAALGLAAAARLIARTARRYKENQP